jgi:subtilase family serine protease
VLTASATAAVGLSLVTAPVAVAASSGPGAASPSGPGAYVPVPTGLSVSSLPGAVAFGTTPPETPEAVSFVLGEQDLSRLEASVEAGVSNYLSVSQFAQAYGQSQENITQLQDYLSQFGIASEVYPDDIDVVANGTAGQFDSALTTQQEQYHVPARAGFPGERGVPAQTVHGNVAPPELPYRLAQYVTAILGLTNYDAFVSNADHMVTSIHATAPITGNACVVLTNLPDACNTPQSFANDYDLTPLYRRGAVGSGQTVGIVTLGALDVGAPEYFWHKVLGLGYGNRTLTVDNVDGGPGAPSIAAGSDETDLDVEQAGGVAPGANVIVYQAPPTDFGFVDAFMTAASQDVAASVSTGWGSSETALQSSVVTGSESPGFQAAFDESFLEMAVQGQSSFVATGDSGAYLASEDIQTTNLSVGSPADSPFTTAAGGTTLPWSATFTGPAGNAQVAVPAQRTWGWDYLWQPIATVNGVTEAAAAQEAIGGGTGGYSILEPRPSYQQGVSGTGSFSAVPYLTPSDYQEVGGLALPTQWDFNATPPVIHGFGQGRAVPDLSTDADPETGFLVYVPSFAAVSEPVLQGGYGGTSFVAPDLSGSTAVIDSMLGHRVGLWGPAIYSLATEPGSPFTPLDQSGTSSDNLFYTGTPGTVYNPGSGLGYPDLSALEADFARLS